MSNQTPFQAVMLEVLEHGQKAEALGFKVLSAMYDMEATFHVEWLKDYHINKNTRGYQADKIRDVLVELLGETYSTILEESQLANKEVKLDPKLSLKKQLAQKKKINLDNRVRSCLEALVFFRIHPLNKDGLRINNQNKTVSFKVQDGDTYPSLTFTDVQTMGNRVAAAQGWVSKPKEKEESKGTSVAKDGKPTVPANVEQAKENTHKLFEASLTSTKHLVEKTELPSMSNEGVLATIELAKACLMKAFGDSKGHITLADLALDFNGIFVHEDGSRVKLEDEKKAA